MRPLTRRLQDRFRCVSYDRAGYGLSAPALSSRAVGIDRSAQDLLALLDALALERAVLCGWSYGGAIVVEAAVRAPARVADLVLLGSVGPGLRWPRTLEEHLIFGTPWGAAALRALVQHAPWAFGRPLRSAYGGRLPTSVLRAFVDGIGAPGTIAHWIAEGRAWQPASMRCHAVSQRCLVVHGGRDTRVPLAVGAGLAAALPRAELRVLDDCGHWPFATHAGEVAEHIARLQRDG